MGPGIAFGGLGIVYVVLQFLLMGMGVYALALLIRFLKKKLDEPDRKL